MAKTNVYLKFEINTQECPPHLEDIMQEQITEPLQEDGIQVVGTGIMFSGSELIMELNLEFDEDTETNFAEFFEYVCGEVSVKLSDYECYVNSYVIEFD